MDQDLKARWVKALRSGDYAQGQMVLRYNNKFCCLGVLCDVSGAGKWVDNDSIYQVDERRFEMDLGSGSLWLRREHEAMLIEMNDEHGASFAVIADWIERNL